MLETGLGTTGKYLLAILLGLALIGLLAWLLRQFTAARRALGSSSRGPRLAVLEAAAVDARRKLVLIRRDNTEHLLLIGGPSDVVVETNIPRAVPVAPIARPARADDAGSEVSLAPAEPAFDPERARAEPKMQRTDPQYLEMAKKLEAAMTKPAEPETPSPRVDLRTTPPPITPEPRIAPQPVAPEPRIAPQPVPTPVATSEPRIAPAPAPEPAAAPRPAERAPEPRPVPPMPTATPVPAPEVAARPKGSEPFISLEEEMASLLRPTGRPQ